MTDAAIGSPIDTDETGTCSSGCRGCAPSEKKGLNQH